MQTGLSTSVPTPARRAARSSTAARWRASETCGTPAHNLTSSTRPSRLPRRPETPAVGSSCAASRATILIVWMPIFPWASSQASRGFPGRASQALSANSSSRPSATNWVTAVSRPTMMTGWKPRSETVGGEIIGGLEKSNGWWSSIRSRSAGRPGRTWRPTLVCWIMSGSSSPRPSRPVPGGTTRAGSPSMWPRAVVGHARAKGLFALNCSFCRACMRRAPRARAPATMPRRWRSRSGIGRSRTCWP